MCGRMNVSDYEGIQEFMEDLGLPIYQHSPEPNYNAAPGVPLVASFANGDSIDTAMMQWGLVPNWALKRSNQEKPFRPLINARAETIWEKPSFKYLINSKRAIIPINGFYEWQRQNNKKTPYYISPAKDKGLALGAIYNINPDGIMQLCIITTEANASMAKIHDRIPVILNELDINQWLFNHDVDYLNQCMKACNDEVINIREVSSYVNNARNNSEKCIAAI